MFEAAEVGHRVSKEELETALAELRPRLLEAQRALLGSRSSVIVIVSGVEAAGKSEVVNRLHEWLDPRGLQSAAFWDESDEERERPRYWRFWRKLPPRGSIGVLFGSWYTQPIVDHAMEKSSESELRAEMEHVNDLERMLVLDGAVIVKLWFHLSKKAQRKRLEKLAEAQERKLTPWEKSYSKLYDQFSATSEIALRATDTGEAPWNVIDAEDPHHRDLEAARKVLDALEGIAARTAEQAKASKALKAKKKARLEPPPAQAQKETLHEEARQEEITLLDRVDLGATLTDEVYAKKLEKAQTRLNALAWKARDKKRSTVVLFEGWDAAGKGGAIRRVTAALDARLYRVIPIAAPTDEERAQHYLWRFWRHLPRAGYFTLYDRSWYGRVMVERVEGFARPEEWRRAYEEINLFEEQLTSHGITLVKFWLHISPEEQLRRFEERQQTLHKQYKITQEDWRNREKWDAYRIAVHEMAAHTSTASAPWTLVAAEDKRHARVQVVRTICAALERSLGANP